ncbi:MAG: hypothetical protein WCA35_08480, partial [Kovacikia sp.]
MQPTASDSAPSHPKRGTSLLRSIGSRLFLSVVGGSLVGLIGTSFLSYRELAKQSEAELRSNLQVKAENLEGDFKTFEASTKLVADAAKTLYAAGERREQIYVDLINRSLQTSSLGTGLGFGQPPEKRLIIPARKYAYPWALRLQDGKVIAKGGDSSETYFQRGYFRDPISAGKPIWTEPVKDLDDTVNPPILVVSTSYSLPFYNAKRELLGVLAQDMELGFLSEKLSKQVMRDAGYFILVSAKGNLIAYPPNSQQALDLKPFPQLNNYSDLWQQIQGTLQSGAEGGVVRWKDAKGKREFW